jgi:hypothetical protein
MPRPLIELLRTIGALLVLSGPYVIHFTGASGTQSSDRRQTVKIVAVEGRPEEIAKLQELTGFLGTSSPDATSPDGSQDAIPEALREFLAQRSGATYRPFIERFVKDALLLGDVVASLGRSTKYKDGVTRYAMFHATGPRLHGAAAYLRPGNGRLVMRLPAKAASGSRFAYPIRMDSAKNYHVGLQLTSAEAAREAVELLKQALNGVRKPRGS